MSPDSTIAASAGAPAGSAGSNSGFGFPKRYRLTKTDEYSSVFGFRRAVKSTHFLLHYRPREMENTDVAGVASDARLGVVVPKRLIKAAVRRNLIKRLGREQFRLLKPQLPANDLVLRLTVRPKILDRAALAIEIRGLLQKLAKQGRKVPGQ